jgi:hypothetical protein
MATDTPPFDWVVPARDGRADLPPPGDHLLSLTAVEPRSLYGGKLAWTFEYVDVPKASRLTIFTTTSMNERSNAIGLLTTLNGGLDPTGLDVRSFIGTRLRALTEMKSNGRHQQFRACRPADPSNTYRHRWVGKGQPQPIDGPTTAEGDQP